MRQPRVFAPWVLSLAVFLFAGSWAHAGPLFVIDFNSTGDREAATGDRVGAFDAGAFGFATEADRDMLIDSVMTALRSAFYDIPTANLDSRSPIPQGQMLDIDFVVGSIGQAPFAGATDYYFVQVGSALAGPNTSGGTLGVASSNAVRRANGQMGAHRAGAIVASVFTNAIVGLRGVGDALYSGNLEASINAIVGTLAHEIGHALSLNHETKASAVTPRGWAPLMGTGAIDLPNSDRVFPREFSLISQTKNGVEQHHVAQLVSALGLRDRPAAAIPEPAALVQAATVLALAGGAMLVRRRRAAA